MVDDREKWDQRYKSGDYQPRSTTSPLIEKAIGYVMPGRALVLASGAGRNALRLAQVGFEVDAIDISAVAVEMAREEAQRLGLTVNWQVADIREIELPRDTYDLITMIRYTNREIWPSLVPALTADGWLLLEQHLQTEREVAGPEHQFRLAPGELLRAFADLRVIDYFETYEPSTRAEKMTATTGILACKGDPGW